MTRFTRQEIEDVYRSHPLRGETIIRRLMAQKGSLAGLSALELAEDASTEVSDQNHIGGLAFTRELAAQAGVGNASRVLDLGCGLGGPARCLAWLYGCRVLGLDSSPERIRDARELTQLVGLQSLVSFECVDVMTAPLPALQFDVLWGQSAWVHLENKLEFLRKWTRALGPQGRLAVEDACLQRPPAGNAEIALVASLEDHWKSTLVGMDGEGGWKGILAGCDFTPIFNQDCSAHLQEHFLKLRRGASQPGAAPVSQFEQESWRLALQAVEAGLIGYFRIVATPQSDAKL
jgi:SAM-dependent methyltransferase